MTVFGDVNVGDKVRLTGKHCDTTIEGVVEWIQAKPGWLTITGAGTYSAENWSVEVLEPAPKPLPTEPGFYTRPDGTELWKLGVDDLWRQNRAVGWVIAGDNRVPADLVRLVPVSAVEEARAEVVKEIVAWLRTGNGDDRFYADQIDSKFGGKA